MDEEGPGSAWLEDEEGDTVGNDDWMEPAWLNEFLFQQERQALIEDREEAFIFNNLNFNNDSNAPWATTIRENYPV
ncbi:hypothetical protein G6F42_028379 [Rhizopus arrhizus]|nr:hypothetical protein G6F42_028379 [Rhizopus arrhizus]